MITILRPYPARKSIRKLFLQADFLVRGEPRSFSAFRGKIILFKKPALKHIFNRKKKKSNKMLNKSLEQGLNLSGS